MTRLWTIIGVANVAASLAWYQKLLGFPVVAPHHTYFGQLIGTDGTVLLCLHEWGHHDHETLMSPENGRAGNGLLLFFRTDDFDAVLQRARSLVDEFEEAPNRNPNTGTLEFSLRDPDAYFVTISALQPS